MDEPQQGACANGVFDAAVFGERVLQPLRDGHVDPERLVYRPGDPAVQVSVRGDRRQR